MVILGRVKSEKVIIFQCEHFVGTLKFIANDIYYFGYFPAGPGSGIFKFLGMPCLGPY